MRCLCVVSGARGHIDGGGLGFVRLAEELARHGHQVQWVTPSHEQLLRLRTLGQAVHLRPSIEWLRIKSYERSGGDSTRADLDDLARSGLDDVYRFLGAARPDVILFDRVLALGSVVAHELRSPHVGVATPGGHWAQAELGKSPGLEPDDDRFEVAERVLSQLSWQHPVSLTSWVDSPHLSVCFLGRSFYPDLVDPAGPTAFVHHFDPDRAPTARHGTGVSFGNTLRTKRLRRLLVQLSATPGFPGPIEVYTGTNDALRAELGQSLRDERFRVHGWVDFTDHTLDLERLVFFGGIGTIWHCLNTSLPMCVVPTFADQFYNGARLEALGLGVCFGPGIDPDPETIRTIDSAAFHTRIEAFKHPTNYTDTLATVAERIGRIGAAP